jgi:hypothetical protein
MNKRILWLSREIDQWVREGVIEICHADAIRSRYPSPEEGLSS